jgi:hypothetical protein
VLFFIRTTMLRPFHLQRDVKLQSVKETSKEFIGNFDSWVREIKEAILLEDSRFVEEQNEKNATFSSLLEQYDQLQKVSLDIAAENEQLVNERSHINRRIAELKQAIKTNDLDILQKTKNVEQIQENIDRASNQIQMRENQLLEKKELEQPHLDFYQKMFAMAIEPVKGLPCNLEGEIKFIMTHINQNSWEQEHWFVLEIVDKAYKSILV